MMLPAISGLAILALLLACTRAWRKVAPLYRRHHVVAALSGSVIAGMALGYLASTEVSYVIGDRIRFIGAPIPVAIFVYEDSEWVDYVLSAAGGLLHVAGNIVMISATLTLVALMVMYGWRRGQGRSSVAALAVAPESAGRGS